MYLLQNVCSLCHSLEGCEICWCCRWWFLSRRSQADAALAGSRVMWPDACSLCWFTLSVIGVAHGVPCSPVVLHGPMTECALFATLVFNDLLPVRRR